MKNIKKHIKEKSFRNFYLLYGEDDYMKRLYKNKLKEALLGDSDDINYSYFAGAKPDINKIISSAETLPFFSDKKVIIIENSNLFSESNELSDYMKTAPNTAFFVFVESKVDKRNKMYKTIKELGYVCEMNGLTEYELMAFAKGELSKEGVQISDNDLRYLINKVGTDMNIIVNECAKLSSYCYEKKVVLKQDINDICITLLENKIFEMLDNVANNNSTKALSLYNDLISIKESPAKILHLITRHYTILYKIYCGQKSGINQSNICSLIKIPPFAFKKYMLQLSKYTEDRLINIIEKCLDIEESFKTGKIDEQIGVEILIIDFSR